MILEEKEKVIKELHSKTMTKTRRRKTDFYKPRREFITKVIIFHD